MELVTELPIKVGESKPLWLPIRKDTWIVFLFFILLTPSSKFLGDSLSRLLCSYVLLSPTSQSVRKMIETPMKLQKYDAWYRIIFFPYY
jgi:hypothetical protein